MGERGNIAVKSGAGHVFLYTHWAGYEIEDVLRSALKKQWRWGDDQYLTRIIFDEMTKGNHGEETGYGISTYIGDNGYPILEVDCSQQVIHRWKDDSMKRLDKTWTFKEFLNATITTDTTR